MLHYGNLLNLKNIGWFSVDQALEITSHKKISFTTNPVLIGLYAFAVCEEKPKAGMHPWEVKYVVDIGKAGGDGESIRPDYKSGINNSPFYKSPLHDRISSHKREYLPKYSSNRANESTKIIREMITKCGCNLWVCILHYETPNYDFSKTDVLLDLTCELYLCESECHYAYKKNWGKGPIGNPGVIAKSKRDKKKTQKREPDNSDRHNAQPNLNFFL